MPTQVSFNLPASETAFARTRSELLAFFQTFTVPDPTISTGGAMKLAASVAYNHWGDYTENGFDSFQIPQPDESIVTIEVPSRANYDELRAKVELLNDTLQNLLEKLRNAGHIQA